MDIQNYCDGMSNELTAWKAKFTDIATKFDHTATGDKSPVVSFVNDLHMAIEEMDERIGALRNNCPTAYESEMGEQSRFGHLKRPMEGSYDFSPSDYGG